MRRTVPAPRALLRLPRSLAAAALLLVLAVPGAGQEAEGGGPLGDRAPVPEARLDWNAPGPVSLPRLTGPVELDGRSDEAAWEAVPPLPVVMHWPDFRGEMTERTEIRLAYDEDHLYASGRFYDAEPGGVRGNSLYRDRWDGDDAFDLVVDSYDDGRTALRFLTTPLGMRLDEEIRNDAEFGGGASPINGDWNGYWDVAVRRTEAGWFAEMRIPWSTLGFDPEGDRTTMGIIAGRYIARKDEKHVFPAIPPEWDLADLKPSLARDVVVGHVEPGAPVYLTPYLLTGARDTRQHAAEAGGRETVFPREVGLDARYGLASNLTLDLSWNTDFSTVEADAERANTGRFDLFFPEKRRFFQERSSVFQFVHGDEGRLFHSRRIGLEDGRPVPVLGGVRLAGRVGSWDLGVLDVQVEGDEDGGRPARNAAVLRARKSIAGGGSTVGGMVTSLATGPDRWDVGAGADAVLDLGGDDYLTLQWAATANEGDDASLGERSLARLFWERRAVDGLGYSLDLIRSGPAYEPALGFESRDDFTALKGRLGYGWQPGEESTVSRHRAFLTGRAFLRNRDGSLESALLRQRWSAAFRGGAFVNVALNWVYEDLDEELVLAEDAVVPPGSYFGPNLFVFSTLGRQSDLTASATLWGGRFLDGWRGMVRLGPSWIVSPHLSLRTEVELHRIWLPDRRQRFEADVARLRVRGALDTHLSAETFLQYNRAAERTSGNVRLRYHFSEGRDLYLVYDEVRDLGTLEPELAPFGRSDRRLTLKYAYTFLP